MATKFYKRLWRRRKQNKERLVRLQAYNARKWNRFFVDYWDVAGKYFAVKSCLNPHLLSCGPQLALSPYKGMREGIRGKSKRWDHKKVKDD